MKTKINLLILPLILLFLILPVINIQAAPADGLVNCGVDAGTDLGKTHPEYTKPCNFNSLIGLVNRIVNFLVFVIALPLAAVMFAFAGFKLITSGGGESSAHAKEIFFNTVIGLIIALMSWLIVHTIFSVLGLTNAWTWIGF